MLRINSPDGIVIEGFSEVDAVVSSFGNAYRHASPEVKELAGSLLPAEWLARTPLVDITSEVLGGAFDSQGGHPSVDIILSDRQANLVAQALQIDATMISEDPLRTQHLKELVEEMRAKIDSNSGSDHRERATSIEDKDLEEKTAQGEAASVLLTFDFRTYDTRAGTAKISLTDLARYSAD